jgi:O-antigen ligase
MAISLFILIPLPILGGQYAGSPLNQDFGQLYSTLISALGIRWVIDVRRKPLAVTLALDNPLALLTLLFVLTIPGSFLSLPIDEVVARIRQQFIHSEWLLFSPKEVFVLFPLVKGFQMLQHLTLFYLIVNRPRSWKADPRQWILSLLLSIILVIGVGILDYYGVIDLRGLRPLDWNVNPGNVQERLQSFFGHSSWCSQYITISISSLLILLAYPLEKRKLVAMIVGILIAGEFVLILAYQRGGWVSYPLTLIVIWFSIYVIRSGNSGASMLALIRRSVLKIAISVPLTVIASLSIFTLITGELPYKYLDRFKAISSMGDRLLYLPVSMDLLSLHPILGGGAFTFTYRYVQEFLLPVGHFFSQDNPLKVYYNNAHSTYLAIAVGQGLIGLGLYIGILSLLLWNPLQLIRRGFEDPIHNKALTLNQRLYALIGLSMAMAFALYGIVDDLFYIASLGFVFTLILAVVVREVPSASVISVSKQKSILMLFGSLLVMQELWEFVMPGPTRELMAQSRHEGCYDPELRPDGTMQRWCSPRFSVTIPAVAYKGRRYGLFQLTPQSKADPNDWITIRVTPHGQTTKISKAQGQQPMWVIVPLDASAADEIELDVSLDNGWIPLRDPKELSLDRRLLSATLDWPVKPPEKDLGRLISEMGAQYPSSASE